MSDTDDFDDLVSGQETATDTSGKYFCINVPDYENTAETTDSDKQSYLRVGAATTDWTSEPGADLAALAYLAGASGKVTAGDGGYSLSEADNALAALSSVYTDVTAADLCDPFIDDQRARGSGNERPDGAPGHGFSQEERRATSAKLHSEVGWRDHTDGNRITTTRGDKVEVVYGNYKLVVMGRQSDPGCSQGWDATGDHIQDWADGTMPGASVTLEWVADSTYGQTADSTGSRQGGAWLLQNSTERVYQYSRYAGNFKEEWWGDIKESYVGSENPEQWGTTEKAGTKGHPTLRDEALGGTVAAPTTSSVNLPRGNPKIIERVWADSIDSRKGSDGHKIPKIHEETWADSVYQKIRAETTYATNRAEIIEDYLIAGVIVEGATAGLHFRGFAGGIIDLFAGPRLQVELAGSVTLTGLWKFEASFGKSWGYHNMKDEMALMENKLGAVQTELYATATKLRNTETKLTNQTLSMTGSLRTDLDATKTTLSKTTTRINGIDMKLQRVGMQVADLLFLG